MAVAYVAFISILFVSVQTLLFDECGFRLLLLHRKSTEKCFDGLGCFTRCAPYHDRVHRPIFPCPEDGICPQFLLYSRTDSRDYKYLEPNKNSLNNSNFNDSLLTIVIVHGYDYDMDPNSSLMYLKDELVRLGTYNVIFVNWTKSGSKPFPQAVSNGRVVGAIIARLLQFLHNATKASLKDMHIISHSLGCHVAGWAGERLRNLGRITGLDPGGPYFHGNPPNKVSLDATDALFVDVIITDGGNNGLEGLGNLRPLGHINFYVNGGSSQPGCSLISKRDVEDQNSASALEYRLDLPNSCSHHRAVELFIESINNTACKFIGLACGSLEECQSGETNHSYAAEMGFHAVKPTDNTAGRKFYLKTADSPPFCKPQ